MAKKVRRKLQCNGDEQWHSKDYGIYRQFIEWWDQEPSEATFFRVTRKLLCMWANVSFITGTTLLVIADIHLFHPLQTAGALFLGVNGHTRMTLVPDFGIPW